MKLPSPFRGPPAHPPLVDLASLCIYQKSRSIILSCRPRSPSAAVIPPLFVFYYTNSMSVRQEWFSPHVSGPLSELCAWFFLSVVDQSCPFRGYMNRGCGLGPGVLLGPLCHAPSVVLGGGDCGRTVILSLPLVGQWKKKKTLNLWLMRYILP